MIKTIIAGGVILSLIGVFFTPDIISIILQVKGSFIYYLSMFFSKLAIGAFMFEIAFKVFIRLFRHI